MGYVGLVCFVLCGFLLGYCALFALVLCFYFACLFVGCCFVGLCLVVCLFGACWFVLVVYLWFTVVISFCVVVLVCCRYFAWCLWLKLGLRCAFVLGFVTVPIFCVLLIDLVTLFVFFVFDTSFCLWFGISAIWLVGLFVSVCFWGWDCYVVVVLLRGLLCGFGVCWFIVLWFALCFPVFVVLFR